MKTFVFLCLASAALILSCNRERPVLFADDYGSLPRGPLGSNMGAHTEYHYLPEARPNGNWAVSAFRYNLPESWYIREVNGKKVLWQKGVNPNKHWHPMVVAGDVLWENYTIHTSFNSLDKEKQCGLAFRYNNDRCYYLLGVKNDTAFVKMVKHAKGFQRPYEMVLASEYYAYEVEEEIKVTVELKGSQIITGIENGPQFHVQDKTYKNGKIAFLADGPAWFNPVEITSDQKDKSAYETKRSEVDRTEQELMVNNPAPVLWKKISTPGFGVGRNLRFGDLNNDGVIDVLVGQVVHHGHKDRNTELSCLTAMTFEGDILGQTGRPDTWRDNLTSDVAYQIHDIDNDGKNEVMY